MSNTILYKWRIYCQTENDYEYTWNTTGITQCPNNASHTVSGSGIVVDSVKAVSITNLQSPYIYNNKSIVADTSRGNIQINLLKAVKQREKVIIIKKIATANTVTIVPFSGDSIAGSTSNYSITTLNTTIILQSNGTNNWANIGDIYHKPDSVGIYNTSNSKGDMFVDTGDEMSRLNIGTDNTVLTADSSTNLGVAWKDFKTFIPNIIFSTSFNRTATQAFTNISTLTDNTVCIFALPRTPPIPTQLTVVACMGAAGSTGTISLKESGTLKVISTIVVNSGVITPTRYTAAITSTTQNLFLLTVRNTSSSGSLSANIYTMTVS